MERLYLDWLAGKRVCIVGPAAYLVGQGRGPEIDAYDVIVRLNLGCPVPAHLRADLGSRTDVLYFLPLNPSNEKTLGWEFGPGDVRAWKRDGVRWCIAKHAPNAERVKRFAPHIDGRIPWFALSSGWRHKLRAEMGTPPGMGVTAIAHILKSRAKRVYVTGMDFHRTGYHEGYGKLTAEEAARGAGGARAWLRTKRPDLPEERYGYGFHNVDAQIAWLARQTDRRLRFDDVLGGLVDGHR